MVAGKSGKGGSNYDTNNAVDDPESINKIKGKVCFLLLFLLFPILGDSWAKVI